jgi:hypothetical protein
MCLIIPYLKVGYTRNKMNKIKVTTKNIVAGKRYSKYRCPIGLACKAAGLDVLVGATYLFDEQANTIATLPRPAVELIAKFDRGKDVTPLEFEVDFKPV